MSRFDKFRAFYKDILQRPLSEDEFNELGRRFARLVVDGVVASAWVVGAREFLERNAGKYLFFIASATPDAEIREIAERKGIQPLFKEVMGSPKKKEAILNELMARYALKNTDVIFVGDAGNDWEASKKAGVGFIWRRTTNVPLSPDFSGPVIETLATLENALARVGG
jgi:HAD superfamily hydrolase (TIGR01549 family)